MTYASAIAAARAAYDPDPPSFAVLDPRCEFLRGQGGNVTSQYGEDGLVAALFGRIGVTSRWCFEVGAADGLHLSNTKALRDDGWSALLIEADEQEYAKLRDCARVASPEDLQKVICVRSRIVPEPVLLRETLDDLLDRYCSAPGVPPDFGVIDIDGADAEVFRHLRCRPRALLVEYNALGDGVLPPPHNCFQAGFDTVCQIGREKGYAPACRTSCNVLFVEEDILAALDNPPAHPLG